MSKRGGFPGGGGNMGRHDEAGAEDAGRACARQEEIKDMTFEATAGGGMVKVVANGDMTVDSIVIDPEAVDPEDVEMLPGHGGRRGERGAARRVRNQLPAVERRDRRLEHSGPYVTWFG